MTRDRQFYKTFFSLCIVLMLQNIITISVNLADNVMLGRFSETALAGAVAVNQIQFVIQQALVSIGEAIVILGSQYWGKRNRRSLLNVSSTAMKAGLIIAALMTFVVSAFPKQVMHLFTENDQIAQAGMDYLSIVRFSYLFFAVTMVTQAVLRCAGIVRISLYLSVMTFFVNCGINFVLIYGRFGAPRLGVRGAAIGTLTARILETVVILIYASGRSHELSFAFPELLREDRVLRKDYIKALIPIMLTLGLWGVNNAVQTMILGHLSDSAIAASSISSTLYLLLKSMAVGASAATAVIIGRTIGEGRMGVLREYSKTLQIIFICIGIISASLLFVIRIPILQLYHLSDETRILANTFLKIQCLICLGMSYQMPTNNGIIRGGGSPEFVAKMDLISIWGIVIPLSLVMAFVVKASPVVVFFCLSADQLFKCIPAGLKANLGTWAKPLTREENSAER